MGRKSNPDFKSIVKTLVFTDISDQQVKEIMKIKQTTSYSQAVRDAVFDYHKKLKPPYLELSPAAEVRKEKITKERAFAAVPDEEFVGKELDDVFIFTDEDNNKWVLYRKISNYVGAVQLTEVKNWVKAADPEYNYHMAVAGEPKHLPYEKELEHNGIRRHLAEHYGVVISFDPTVN